MLNLLGRFVTGLLPPRVLRPVVGQIWHCWLLEDHLTSERELLKTVTLVCLWCQCSRPRPVPDRSRLPQTCAVFLLRTPRKDARGIKPKRVLYMCRRNLVLQRGMAWVQINDLPSPEWSINALFLKAISVLFLFCHCTVCACYSSWELLQLKCKWSLCLVEIISGPHDQLGCLLLFSVGLCVCSSAWQDVLTTGLQFFTFFVHWCFRNSCSSLHVWGFEIIIPELHWNS